MWRLCKPSSPGRPGLTAPRCRMGCAQRTWTAGAVLVELALGVLVWNKRCRPWVLAAGVLLHLGIDFNIEIGIFSYAMLVLYVAWLAPDTPHGLPDTIKHATTRLRARLRRGPHPQAAPPPPTPAAEPDQLITTYAELQRASAVA